MILYGKPVADKLKEDISNEVSILKSNGLIPTLAIIQLMEDESLEIYLNSRKRLANELGIHIVEFKFNNPSFEEIYNLINGLNNDDKIWGIMIDNPIPKYLDFNDINSLINPNKDVEGFTYKKSTIVPVAKAVLEVMKYYKIPYNKEKISVLGNSKNVGKPIANLLKENGCKVDTFDDPNTDVNIETKTNKIVIVCINKIEYIKKENLNKNSIVFDIGTHYSDDGRLCGDVDRNVIDFVESICPSPKGVGPITSVMLFKNLLELKNGKL